MKSFVWIVLIAVTASVLLFFSDRVTNREQEGISVGQDLPRDRSAEAEPAGLPEAAAIKDNPFTEKALLGAVDGSASEGLAYKLLADKYFLHFVEAQMPEPAKGNVYEGWLVRPEPLDFFSTGLLEENETGKWELEYIAESDFPAHTRVVITEETEVDEIPETHIVEGDFNQVETEKQ